MHRQAHTHIHKRRSTIRAASEKPTGKRHRKCRIDTCAQMPCLDTGAPIPQYSHMMDENQLRELCATPLAMSNRAKYIPHNSNFRMNAGRICVHLTNGPSGFACTSLSVCLCFWVVKAKAKLAHCCCWGSAHKYIWPFAFNWFVFRSLNGSGDSTCHGSITSIHLAHTHTHRTVDQVKVLDY